MRYAVAVQIPKKKKKKKPHTINGQILFGMKNEFVAPSRMVLPVLFLCNKDIPSCGRPSPCSTVEVFFFFFPAQEVDQGSLTIVHICPLFSNKRSCSLRRRWLGCMSKRPLVGRNLLFGSASGDLGVQWGFLVGGSQKIPHSVGHDCVPHLAVCEMPCALSQLALFHFVTCQGSGPGI